MSGIVESGEREARDRPSPSPDDRDRKRRLTVGAALVAAMAIFCTGETGQLVLGTRSARPLEFRARRLLGRDPGLSPRIKVYGFGDSSKEYFAKDALSLADWTELLAGLVPSAPAVVLIDNHFSTPAGLSDGAAFAKALANLPFPVHAGAFVARSPIQGRSALAFEAGGYDLRDRVEEPRSGQDRLGALDWLPILGGYVYGPHTLIRASFRRLGQMSVDEGNVSFRPLLRVTRDHALTALPLLGARSVILRGRALEVDGHEVPMDGAGNALVNYSAPDLYYDEIHPVSGLFKSIRGGKPPPQPAGATIVFLTQLTTGETKFFSTPFGSVPAGFALLATLHSALTGDWLARLPYGWLAVVGAGAAGLALAEFLGTMGFWCALGGMELLLALVGIVAFTYGNLQIPWLASGLCGALAGLAVFVDKARTGERRRQQLREALEGMVSPSQLHSFLHNPESFHVEPTGRVVTVLFIDIVGFSMVAERHVPREVFTSLRDLIAELAEIVHLHGGIVDKTIGDGMLCFFGYRYDGTEAVRDHPAIALKCAVEIQRRTVERQLSRKGQPIYPLRIGIHTAAVYIGNLGGPRKIDMTLIGHGVNFAKRLESACDSYSIILSASTRDQLLEPDRIGGKLVKRYIQVKNYDDLVEVYECDPFAGRDEVRAQALKAYREDLGIERRSPRWTVPPEAVVIGSEAGRGSLLNFSMEGLAISLDRYLGRGVTISLLIEPDRPEICDRLRNAGLLPLVCEVRWGRPGEGRAEMLGLHVKNLSKPQRELLVEEIRALIAVRPSRAA